MEKGVQGLRLTSEEDLLTRPAKYDKCKTGTYQLSVELFLNLKYAYSGIID